MAKKSKPEIIWNTRAAAAFRELYEYISQESAVNAERVRISITKIIDGLPDNPERFPLDRFKKNNSGIYRAFEKYSYRIAYKHTEKEIIILRIRHVKREPKPY